MDLTRSGMVADTGKSHIANMIIWSFCPCHHKRHGLQGRKRRMRRTSETPRYDRRETDSPRSVSTEREHRIERLGWKNYGYLSRIQPASATSPLPPPHRKRTRTVPDGRTRSAQPGIRQEISAKGRSNICRLAVTTKRKPRCRHLRRGFCEVWSEAHYSLIIWYLRYFTLLDSWI